MGDAGQGSIIVEAKVDPAVNYAVQQNAVAVIKGLRITNTGVDALASLRVVITAEPAFADSWEQALESIAAGETVDLGAIDLVLSHDFLSQHTEAVRGSFCIQVIHDGQQLGCQRVPIDVLAYDQWGGMRVMPELLAAFVMPNHPAVEQLIRQASGILKSWTGSPSFDAYQSKDPGRARMQMAALFAAIKKQAISYCGVPASFEVEGQKIRTPDRILTTRLGNCLDLSTLFAACLEQVNLHPLIIFTQGHAFVGAWLMDESFADSAVDDPLAVRKRVQLGEICLVESTLAVDGSQASFEEAEKTAISHLDDPNQFLFTLDVFRARIGRVRPLPLRRPTTDGVEVVADPQVEEPGKPEEPPTVVVSPQPGIESGGGATAATRLDRWKRKLLDLSLRNPLINFRLTRSIVLALVTDLALLEDLLAEGPGLTLHPRPTDWTASERDPVTHRQRTGEDAERALLDEELRQRRLHCDLDENEMPRRLVGLYRAARTALQENGANTLFLALGMLTWYESPVSEPPRRAPILLLPVELQRRSAQSRFSLRRIDDEPVINVTLLELLRHDFGLDLRGLEQLPMDDSGVDVEAVLNTFRHAVKEIPRWEVTDNVHLGLFSFSKFLMWRDLQERTEEIQRNRLVSSLINFPESEFQPEGSFPLEEQLDTQYPPNAVLSPLSADSSQLAAVIAAGENKSFVLHGPPGTGKSQTITNIIAHAIALGKTVLFVSEKMAALNVVQRRLEQIGLGPFCLELHSNKSQKSEVIRQLGEALAAEGESVHDTWEAEATRLSQARQELNNYVQALHKSRNTGESFFTGLSKLMALRDAERVRLDPQMLMRVTGDDLNRMRDRVKDLVARGRACGHPHAHVWEAVRLNTWTPQLRDDAAEGIARLQKATHDLEACARQVAAFAAPKTREWSGRQLEALNKLAQLFLSKSTQAPSLIATIDWEDTRQALMRWIAHGKERDALRTKLYERYTERLLQLDLQQLEMDFAAATVQWFVPRWLGHRRVTGTLRQVLKPGQRLAITEVVGDLAVAQELSQKEQLLGAAGEQARALLGRLWRDGEADWGELQAAADWAGALRPLAQAIAGGDARGIQDLRHTWAAILAEQAELLEDEGLYAGQLRSYQVAYAAWEESKKALTELLSLDEELCCGLPTEPDLLGRWGALLAKWESHDGQLRFWCAWLTERQAAMEHDLAPLVQAYEQGQLAHDQVERAFERSFYEGWTDEIVGKEAALRLFSRQSVEERVHRFRLLDERFATLTKQEIRARVLSGVPRASGSANQNSEMGILRHELQKRTRHMALRALFQKIPNLLPRLKPCLLMSPISVAQYLDPAHPAFDLVVFDEASQVPTWDAVGAIARGSQCIVVGDPKQLPPTSTSFFARQDDDSEDDSVGTEDLESILDDCLALRMPEMTLRWHYRSRHESLITFSNYSYYKQELLTFPSPQERSAVHLQRVDGVYDRSRTRTNRVEAEAVVAEVVRRLRDSADCEQSIGVVTFSVAQQGLVEDLLDEARVRYPEIEPYFNGGLEPVFVKNLENVQGDERDVILFSICYGPDSQGRVSLNFGPLNRNGGERRLNVAITRARQEVIVFASLDPEQIDLSRSNATGVHHLRSFLEYAKRGVGALQEKTGYSLATAESPFEQDVGAQLAARGYQVVSQVGYSGYRIDLAVVHPQHADRFLLGIECDGANYHQAKTARDRDSLRQQVLQGLGWRLHRIWSSDWWHDRDGELARVEAAIAAALEAPVTEVMMRPPTPPAVEDKIAELVASPPLQAGAPLTLPGFDLSGYQASQASCEEAGRIDLYSTAAVRPARRLISKVIGDEAPMSLTLLCQRVASQWGIARITPRLQTRVSRLIGKRAKRVTHGEDIFLWGLDQDPKIYDQFREHGAGDAHRRKPEDLPPEEVANAAYHVLQAQVSLPPSDLVREVGRLFGYQRAGQNVERYVRRGIDLLIEKEWAEMQDDMVVVVMREGG